MNITRRAFFVTLGSPLSVFAEKRTKEEREGPATHSQGRSVNAAPRDFAETLIRKLAEEKYVASTKAQLHFRVSPILGRAMVLTDFFVVADVRFTEPFDTFWSKRDVDKFLDRVEEEAEALTKTRDR